MNKKTHIRLLWNEDFEREAYYQNIHSHEIDWRHVDQLRRAGMKPKDAASVYRTI